MIVGKHCDREIIYDTRLDHLSIAFYKNAVLNQYSDQNYTFN